MKRIIITFLFSASLFTVLAQDPARSAPPKLGPVKDLQLPPLQRLTLSNGMHVLLMEKHGVPLVQVNLLIQTGSAHDPEGKEGLCAFTADMLDEGAGKYNALELADEIEYLGAQISTYGGTFTSGVNCLAPLSKLDPSLSLMADIALRPRFDEAEVERIRKLRLNGLLQHYDQPTVIAARAFSSLLFEAKSPYSRFQNEASLKAIRRDDLVSFHQSNVTATNGTLIVVGDVTAGVVKPLLEKYFAAVPAGTAIKAIPQATSAVKKRVVYLVDKPGAAQSVIRIGRMGPAHGDKDYYANVVMNTILGGSFASRLNTNLREVHGYSYGAGSYFYFWPVPGPFVASSSVQTDVTAPALKEFLNEFNGMRKALPPADLDRGRNYEALSYPANFETNSGIADELANLVIYKLPDHYFNDYINNVLRVSKEATEGSARRYSTPESMLVVVVGDRSKIEKGIRALNLGSLTVLSVEDVLGKKPVIE